ncbi:vacuolar protein sorting-associated protein 8 homolog [Leptopilina boulardi]|uniref:vacuolar protein sorting-associated protein 8 homolog n=1 Tax=Leptopilina boulardi TaxID=63433 RepID=UPI0021F67F2B|nr:vacuolar protein sorting-associated protein 8 homolog [Leptopilina boulardi]
MAENGSVDIGSLENLTAEAINLEIEELDDAEYAIPIVEELPSLESILTEPDCASLSGTDDDIGAASIDKLGGSETASVGSLLSLNSLSKQRTTQTPASGAILRHVILKGICAQITSASEKINAGLASAVAAGGNMLVIGTSHGLVLGFDSTQTLRWCDQEARHQGSVSALGFNHDGSRLLAGFARGYILMIDSSNGKVLRTLTDVHPPGTAVLHVKFTDSPKLALCSDSGGSVFELNFTRVMGVRGCDSKLLFSGARGEVCTFEPLLLNDLPTHPLKNYTLVAMATLSKVIVVCIRPRMRIVLCQALTGPAFAPPQVSWQLVVIQAANATRVIDPVLALGRDSVVHFYQVCTECEMNSYRIKLTPLRKVVLPYTMSNLRWLNARSLIILDIQERLHLLDVRTQDDLETLDVSCVGISYASSHFKGLTTGGNVSKAMSMAGERACYNTVVTFGSQLLLLGTKSLHAVCIRTWMERLRHLTLQRRFQEALALGLTFYQDKGKAVVGLRGSKQRRKQIARDKVCQVLIQYMDELNNLSASDATGTEIVSYCVDYCVQLENTELLFGRLWDLVSESENLQATYLCCLESPLLEGSMPPSLPPIIAQNFVTLYEQENRLTSLQAVVILLKVDCLDIHQVTTVCRNKGLWEALIHLQKTALGDFTAPIHQLVPVLQNKLADEKEVQSYECITLGNALLVYCSCCLAGRDFPKGELPEGLPKRVKADVLRALLSQHSSLATDTERQYPYLRTFLKFDVKGFLDVIAMAFQEPEFTTEMGLRQRQRIVDILLTIVMPSTPLSSNNPDYLVYGQRVIVFIFIINEVAENMVSLEGNVLNRIVEILAAGSEQTCLRDFIEEKENAILQLIDSRKLTNMSDTTLLNLSQRANFLRVSELLYTDREEWSSVIRCLIADPSRHGEIWSRLQLLPITSLYSVLITHIISLVEIDASQLANIIASRVATKLNKILEKLEDNSVLQYSLLSALFQLMQFKEEESKLELSTEILEKYLTLMCQVEPEYVASHLHGSHGCRLDEALKIVQNTNHKDGEAIMLEKLGNYEEAFNLLLKRLEENLSLCCQTNVSDVNAVQITTQLAALCRRAAGTLDWMPLVETVLHPHSDNNIHKAEKLRGKLLKIVLESLSGTTALSMVLEQILKHPLATSGTIGDIRQLLTSVLTHSRYEQTLVETTSRLVSLEIHEALKRTLRDSGKGCSSNSLTCPICRQKFANCTEYIVIFGCGHGYHVECLSESKVCYKCLNTKGWTNKPVNFTIPPHRPPEKRQLQPPTFMRNKDTSLRLAPPIPWPDLEGIF